MAVKKFVLEFNEVSSRDAERVGGKNAALGEMIRALKKKRVRVPDGFATTADAFRLFLRENKIDKKIRAEIEHLKKGSKSLIHAGKALRLLFLKGKFPEQVEEQIREAYCELSKRYKKRAVDVAVRSSATAEDLPEASFAGQQETFLNISGEDAVIEACRKCYASLFTDRAISYREEKGFDHLKIALSAGVQKMVRADKAGVMFSIDTESGFPNVVRISAAWGLGEVVVKGAVNPDEYTVFKPLLGKKKTQPILGKSLGDKKRKVVYGRSRAHVTRTVNTTKKERESSVLDDNEIASGRMGVRDREAFRSSNNSASSAESRYRKIGICGEAPSDYPDFAAFLVKSGIDSISINPDRFIETKKIVAKAERKR